MAPRTVVLCWQQKYATQGGFRGIGDLIRGTLFMHWLSTQEKFDLVVDLSAHPVASFLARGDKRHAFRPHESLIPFFNCESEIRGFLRSSAGEVVFMMTNSWCEPHQVSEKGRDFVREMLTPNSELSQYWATQQMLLPNEYKIIHLRFGDNLVMSFTECTSWFERLKKFTDDQTVILTDNADFKAFLLQSGSDTVPRLITAHSGITDDHEAIRDALTEFLMITKATSAQAWSVYGYTSGFVNWACVCWGVPLSADNLKSLQ